MLSCREASRLLSESQDQRLPWRQRMSLKLHIAMCSGCRSLGRQMDSLRGISRQYRHHPDRPEDGD